MTTGQGSDIAALATSFPSLRESPSLEPWNADKFDQWALDADDIQALWAAKFVLQVWDGDRDWLVGPFDVFDAIAVWDEVHRHAFVAWASAPWWPAGRRM